MIRRNAFSSSAESGPADDVTSIITNTCVPILLAPPCIPCEHCVWVVAERDYHVWVDALNLLLQLFHASEDHLVGNSGVGKPSSELVVWRAITREVCVEHVLWIDTHFGEAFFEELACCTDEGLTETFFVCTWSFANHHEFGVGISSGTDILLSWKEGAHAPSEPKP